MPPSERTLGGVKRQTFAPNLKAQRSKRQVETGALSHLLAGAAAPEFEVKAEPDAHAPAAARMQQSQPAATRFSPRLNPQVAAGAAGASGTEPEPMDLSNDGETSSASQGALADPSKWLLQPDAPLCLPLTAAPSTGPAPLPTHPAAPPSEPPRSPADARRFPEGSAAATLFDAPTDGASSDKLLIVQLPMKLPVPSGAASARNARAAASRVRPSDYMAALSKAHSASYGGAEPPAEGADGAETQEARPARPEDSLAEFSELAALTPPPGQAQTSGPAPLGELLVYKSGDVRLRVGEYLFHVEPGTACSFEQELIAMGPPAEHVELLRLGELSQRVIVTPDVEHLLKRCADDRPAATGR